MAEISYILVPYHPKTHYDIPMSEHECPVCEADNAGAMDCAEPQLCPSCGHTHNDTGCALCACDLCPKCGHVHVPHDETEEEE